MELKEMIPSELIGKELDPNIKKTAVKFIEQQNLYNSAIKEIKTKLEILDEEFKVKYDRNPIHHIESRLKSPQSIVGKLQRKGLPITPEAIKDNLTDVAGIRVVCNYIDDIDNIAKLLVKQDDIELIEKCDYVSNPKESGYRSLHLVVTVPVFLAETTKHIPVEIQIRTIAMDFWASLEHQLKYKSNGSISPNLKERLQNCAEFISRLDNEMQSIYKEIEKKDK